MTRFTQSGYASSWVMTPLPLRGVEIYGRGMCAWLSCPRQSVALWAGRRLFSLPFYEVSHLKIFRFSPLTVLHTPSSQQIVHSPVLILPLIYFWTFIFPLMLLFSTKALEKTFLDSSRYILAFRYTVYRSCSDYWPNVILDKEIWSRNLPEIISSFLLTKMITKQGVSQYDLHLLQNMNFFLRNED